MPPGFQSIPVSLYFHSPISCEGTKTERGYDLIKQLIVLNPFDLNSGRDPDSPSVLNRRWGQSR